MLLLSNDWGDCCFVRVRDSLYLGLPLLSWILAFVGHLGCTECEVGGCGSRYAPIDFLLGHVVSSLSEGVGRVEVVQGVGQESHVGRQEVGVHGGRWRRRAYQVGTVGSGSVPDGGS